MRTVTGAETTVLNSAHFATFARVLVEDADGTYQDLTGQDSIDWVHSGRIAQTIDQIVATGDFTFWRKQEGGNSLAPLDEASLLNRDIVPAYAPLIDVGRGIRCDFATVAIGASPGGSDWKRVFTGVIDRWNVEDDFVLVSARDAIGAEIADRWIEAETDYGTGPGRAIEDVMQDILTAWTTGITLYTPASPSFLVTTYTQQRSSIMDALQQLAALVGWVIQPKWDDGTSAYRLTFYEPDRAPASTDWTWADNRYEAIPNFSLDRLHIRNALSLWYTNTSGVRSQVTASDATSITNYDRQWMEIEEPDDSPIDTATEAQDMIDAALLDLKDPIANQEMKTFCFWPVQLGDYFQFNGNAVHYSANQAFGITGFRHEFGGGHIDTFIRTRGKPAGFIKPWIARGNVVAPSSSVTTFRQASAPTATQIGDLWIDSDDGDRLYRWSGTAWVDVQDADIATAQADATQAIADAATAQGTADGKVVTFIQASAPTADGTGDLWFDSDDGNKLYRWSGAAWVEVQDDDIAQAISDALNAQTTADGKITTFYQASAPTAEGVGDLWHDTDDGKSYRWDGTDWNDSFGDVSERRPTAFVKEVRSSGTSVITIDIIDPDLRVTAIEFKKRDGSEGGDTLDASWQTAWTSTTGTIGTSTTLQRVINVPVAAGLEGEVQWRMQFTDLDGNTQTVGDSFKVVNLEATSGSVMVTYASIIPLADFSTWTVNTGGSHIRPGSASAQNFVGTVELPPNVTATSVVLIGYREGTGDKVEAVMRKVADTATTATIIVTVTHDTTGWQAKSATISELIAANTIYTFHVQLDAATTATHVRFRGFKVLFDRPAYQYTI